MATSYDAVAYPSATFPQTHPDRLAVIARLHGLEAPPVDRARVLEIGGGDGFNVIAVAAAFPNAQFLSFDLSAEAVARGQALVTASDLENVRVEKSDILEMAETIEPGAWDYIIAHGVFAWVPEVVQQATMALAARALSPHGVFFVSYNARPGGHVRQVLRDMLLHALADVSGISERISAARAFLEDYAVPQEDDDTVVSAMRAQAMAMLQRPDAVLFHDELGEVFEPRHLSEVVTMASASNLEFLGDSGKNRLLDGFAPDELPDAVDDTAAIVRRAQAADFSAMRFFRQSLFVHAGRKPARRPQLDTLGECYCTGAFTVDPDESGTIRAGDASFALRDADLTQRLLELGAAWPVHVRVDAIARSHDHREVLFRLFTMGLLHLTTQPAPFALTASHAPCVSPLVRGQLRLGTPMITTLHFEQMRLDDPSAKALLMLLDGIHDRVALDAEWARLDHDPSLTLDMALSMIAQKRLLRA